MGSHSSSDPSGYSSDGRMPGGSGIGDADVGEFADVVAPDGEDLDPGGVIEVDGERMLVVDEAEDVDAALAVPGDVVREHGAFPDRFDPEDWAERGDTVRAAEARAVRSVNAEEWRQDVRRDGPGRELPDGVEVRIVGPESAAVDDLPGEWLDAVGVDTEVFGGDVDQFDDDRAGLERYREAVTARLRAGGVDVPDEIETTPEERVESYLDDPRAVLDRQFSERGRRSGGLPDASFALENVTNYGGGFRRVDAGTMSSTGDRAYLAEYTGRRDLFRKERATYAFLDAAGVRVPRHEFDADPSESGLEARSMSREASGTPVNEIDATRSGDPNTDEARRLLDSLDREQAMDQMSMQLLNGNWDVSSDNLLVTDGRGGGDPASTADDDRAGNLVCHDLDRGASRIDTQFSRGLNRASSTLNRVGVSAGGRQVFEHTQEMAREMVESGDLDRVTDAVARVDPQRAKLIAHNVAYFALDPDDRF